jgi:hypothetical protein
VVLRDSDFESVVRWQDTIRALSALPTSGRVS